jgi:ATP-dependent exoDNAse (exonuclease V) beta subunit (contains helicase and exonuclease domains)
VALLTIHKSKGLEFPVVVLPDLQRRWRQSAGKFVFERNSGLGFDVPDMLGRRRPTALKSLALERIERREQFERMRQLYVAMTRAQTPSFSRLRRDPKPEMRKAVPSRVFWTG